MKKILSLFIVLSISILLFGCSGNDGDLSASKGNSSETISSDKSEESSSEISSEKSEENVSDDEPESKYNITIPDPKKVGFTKYSNPFIESASDPYVVCKDGKYYYCYAERGKIYVSTFNKMENITTDGGKPVLSPTTRENWGTEIWAPELHWIDGNWYIYFSGCANGDGTTHRMFVLKSKTDDPMGEYETPVQITDPTDKWAIDGTVFKYKDQLYYAWSGWVGDINIGQNIYIAKMASPMEISGERVAISTPYYDWEKNGGMPYVNEGPCAIVDGDYLTILYSASGSWCDDYCVGQLLFTGDDLLEEDSWTKIEQPILMKNMTFYGPGHCSICPDENGVMWMYFHANKKPGTSWAGRSGWRFPIRINEEGIVKVIKY